MNKLKPIHRMNCKKLDVTHNRFARLCWDYSAICSVAAVCRRNVRVPITDIQTMIAAEKDRLRDIADDIGVLRRQEIRETDRDVGETVRDEPSYKFPCTSSWPPIEQLHCSPPGLWLFPFGILVYKAQVFPRVFRM